MSNFETAWYVIYTRPRHERKVADELSRIAINHYLPTKKVLRTWHDRKKCIITPLFPSYIFVYLKDIKDYHESLKVQGVLQFVRLGKQMAKVKESVVNYIRLVTDQAKELEVCENFFQPGRLLVISQGALSGLTCEIVEYQGNQKVLLRVELLHRNILVALPPEYLMAV